MSATLTKQTVIGSAGARTTVDFWFHRQAAEVRLDPSGQPPPWLEYARPHLPPPGSSCLEVGVVPGHQLMFLATRMRYLATGIDLSPRIEQTRAAFESQGVHGRFVHEDLFRWSPGQRFDFVYSCGFVEHFDALESVVRRHWDLVAPGGLLLLTVPTLTPFQRTVRRLVYTRQRYREMLASHNVRSMSLRRLRSAVGTLPGATLLEARYLRHMALWFGRHTPGVRRHMTWVLDATAPARRLARQHRWNSPLWSPECMVLARRSADDPASTT